MSGQALPVRECLVSRVPVRELSSAVPCSRGCLVPCSRGRLVPWLSRRCYLQLQQARCDQDLSGFCDEAHGDITVAQQMGRGMGDVMVAQQMNWPAADRGRERIEERERGGDRREIGRE